MEKIRKAKNVLIKNFYQFILFCKMYCIKEKIENSSAKF